MEPPRARIWHPAREKDDEVTFEFLPIPVDPYLVEVPMNTLIVWLLLSASPALINGERFLFQVAIVSYLPDGDVSVVRTMKYLSFEEAQDYAPYTKAEWERMRLIAKDVHHFSIIVDRSIA